MFRKDTVVDITYTTYSAPTWSIKKHIALAKHMGCNALELRNIDNKPIDPAMPATQKKDIADEIHNAGLKICVLGSDCKLAHPSRSDRHQAVHRAIEFVELAKAWKAPIVRVFGGRYQPGPSDDEANAWVAESLREVADAGDEHGIQIAIETHDAFSTSQRVRKVLDLTNHPRVGVVWDFGHPYRLGESVAETWDLIGTKTIHVHFKDIRHSRKGRNGWEPCLPGTGDLPLQEMVNRLKATRYSGHISTEWEGRSAKGLDDPREALFSHTAYLRKLLGNN
tara:strand:+ start:325 stop:1164 length:840 start_codon:yes stop_codon:yes gene_type:complete